MDFYKSLQYNDDNGGFMFALLSTLLIIAPAHSKSVIIKPGHTQTLYRNQIFSGLDKELVITCENEPKCTINYEFVRKEFNLKMPNGRIFGHYKTTKEAISEASNLISSKICDRLIIDVDENKIN